MLPMELLFLIYEFCDTKSKKTLRKCCNIPIKYIMDCIPLNKLDIDHIYSISQSNSCISHYKGTRSYQIYCIIGTSKVNLHSVGNKLCFRTEDKNIIKQLNEIFIPRSTGVYELSNGISDSIFNDILNMFKIERRKVIYNSVDLPHRNLISQYLYLN